MKKKGSNSIRHGRALRAQHAISAHLQTLDFHDIGKLGSVADLYFQKQDRVMSWKVMILAVFRNFPPIRFRVALLGVVGDDADRPLSGRLVQETLRCLVDFETLYA
jgi:hypothetical protein